MTTNISFSEFNTFSKCHLLWWTRFVKKENIETEKTYKDYFYNEDINVLDEEVPDDVKAKAIALKSYYKSLNLDEIFVGGSYYIKSNKTPTEDLTVKFYSSDIHEFVLVNVGKPIIYENKSDEKQLLIVSKFISGSYLKTKTLIPNSFVRLQRKALIEKYRDVSVDIAYLVLMPSSIKMKKSETDEEFEERKQQLCKKSKSGISRAQKSLGETYEEFLERYKKGISHEIVFEKENEYTKKIDTLLENKIADFMKAKSSNCMPTMNDTYCPFCDHNKPNGLGCVCIHP